MTAIVTDPPALERRTLPRWLFALGLLGGLTLLIALLLSANWDGLLHKLVAKIAPPDPYQLQQFQHREHAVTALLAANPTDATAWLEAATFELEANSPYGAAWCLDQARVHGASATDIDKLKQPLQAATGRWTTLYGALLGNHRFADGKNTYTEIYPLIQHLRGDETDKPLTGKVRADLDLLEAQLLLREGRRTEARPIFAALNEQPGPLQGLASYFYAKSLLREESPEAARKAFHEYLIKYPGERLNAYAAYELGNLALQAGDQAGAETWFTEVMIKHSDSPQARAAVLAMLDITFGVVPKSAPASAEAPEGDPLFDLGATPDELGEASEPKSDPVPAASPAAIPVAEPVTVTGLHPRLIPDSIDGWNLYGNLFRMAPTSLDVQRRALLLYREVLLPEPPPFKIFSLLTPSSALGWADCLAAAGVEKGAIRLADWGVAQPGDATHKVQLARLRGRILIGQRKFELARTGLEAVRKSLAGTTDVAMLDYELARSWRLAANAGKARPYYLRAAAGPDAELAADAYAQAAWAAAQGGDWTAALADYRTLIAKFPDSVYADAAREHLLSDALRRNDERAALSLAETLATTASKGGRHVRGTYYALQLKSASSTDWASFFDRYALTYYGTQVATLLKKDFRAWSPSASALTFAQLRAQESSVAGATFLAGLWDISQAEWDAQPNDQAAPDPFRLLGESLLTSSEGVPRDTILVSQTFLDRGGPALVPPGWTNLLLEASFPLQYITDVQTEAERYQVPAPIILGVIRQESFFNPKARSGAGARGLMQLMPATGTWAAKQVGMGAIQLSDLETPATNLRLATWHLDFLRKVVGQSFGLVLAAHNGGPGNLAKWQEKYGGPGIPEWLFLELIPNQESREFVRQVSANQAVYTYLLARQERNVVF